MTTTFADLGVPAELVSTLKARGILAPFAIQTLTVADGCAGRDLCGRAPTGSGKTIAFGIPLAMRLSRAAPKRPTGLVLVPTRELAAQVCGELEWLGRQRKLRVAAVYGGAGFGAQLKALRRGVDVLVACPGRLTDLMERGEVRLDAVEIVVVDEADRMADMGFLPVVQRLLDATPQPVRRCCSRRRSTAPSTRSCVVTSATRCATRCRSRRRISRGPPTSSGVCIPTSASTLCADVIKLAGPTIVFCKTKRGTDRIARRLDEAGVRTEAIHGNRSQSQRERALALFATGIGRRARRDRRRGARHPRRQRRLRRALRSSERRQGLHAPFGPHGSCRGSRHGRVVRREPASARGGANSSRRSECRAVSSDRIATRSRRSLRTR